MIALKSAVITKEQILDASLRLIREKGWQAFNIRAVAAECGVSIGSIYNYFPLKSDLAIASVESIFQEIFRFSSLSESFSSVRDYVLWFFQRLEYGSKAYPGFFNHHALMFMQEERSDGRRYMEQVFTSITDHLVLLIRHDPNIASAAFSESFTPEHLADLLFSLLLAAYVRKNYDPQPLLKLIDKLLYA